jgi:3-deoxy-D-manno-octulosonic-acid transferase
MARRLYTLFLWLGLPWVLLRLLVRSWRQREYLGRWGERFGRYGARPVRPVLWCHAVSVGEVRAAQPLIDMIATQYSTHELVVTCMTPTGRATATALYAARARVVYLPYDYPFAVRRFLAHFRPRAGLVMETEIWPNLVALCQEAGVPLALVNARLSARSARRYGHVAALAAAAFGGLARVAAQTAADARRLQAVGARQVEVTGNLKFDVEPSPVLLALGRDWRAPLGTTRPVLLAASTREGEETQLFDALRPLVEAGALLVVVPRHPQRFDEVETLLRSRGAQVTRRSECLPDARTQVWLGDSMGEMAAYYAMADCAYIGGSLLPFGGQNLIEAAACGTPALIGPHTWNFTDAAAQAVEAGAALRVADFTALGAEMARLAGDPARRARMVDDGAVFCRAHRGATARTMALVEPLFEGR